MLTPAASPAIATPTGCPSRNATPTSVSAPGASGTNAKLPVTVARPSAPAAPTVATAARAAPLAGSALQRCSSSLGGCAGRYAARRSPVARSPSSSTALGASPRMAVAGRCPSSGMPASTRPHSPSTSIASKASSPAPPLASSISRPGQPASLAVGHRSGSACSSPSSASRAACSVLKRESAPRAASRRNTCSSESARFMPLLLPWSAAPRMGFPCPGAARAAARGRARRRCS